MSSVVKSSDKAALALIVPVQPRSLDNEFRIFSPPMLHSAPSYVHIMKISDRAK